MAVPILYFALLFTAGAFHPDFSHVRQVASELGANGAPYGGTAVFNMGLITVGLVGCAGAAGLFTGLYRAGANTLLAALTAVTFAAPNITFVTSGLWPLPHPWHSSVILLLLGFFSPLLAVLALRPVDGTRSVKVVLGLCFVSILIVFNGLGGLSAPDLAGLRWRLIALLLLGSFALLCWTVRSRVSLNPTQR